VIGLTHATGIPNSSTFFSYIVGDGFRPGFHPLKIAVVAAIFLAVAVLAPLLPALRGARLSIMKTLEKR
jgi:ABC-type lipoprotein release transport system permease subunit